MRDYIKLLFLFILILVIGCKNSDKNQLDGTYETVIKDDYSFKIDSLIETTKPRKFNGVILVTHKGDTMYSKAYGYSDKEAKIPIDLNDNFRIQSISKQVTAVLILREVENGRIGLENPIERYLPEIKQNWSKEVTVHQLLNMSSGIISIDKPLLFKPGTEFYYSNAAYGILGRIIEKVTGKEYIEIANTLFEELAMNKSYCYELGMTNNDLINGYSDNGQNNELSLVSIDRNLADLSNPKEWWKDFIPAGGIISNLNDLSIWDKNLHNGKLLKPETYTLMTNGNGSTDFFKAYGKEKIGYGYGLCISGVPHKSIGHAGKGLGFSSFKFYVPAKDLNVIILQNLYYDDSNIIFHFEREIRIIIMNSNLLK